MMWDNVTINADHIYSKNFNLKSLIHLVYVEDKEAIYKTLVIARRKLGASELEIITQPSTDR